MSARIAAERCAGKEMNHTDSMSVRELLEPGVVWEGTVEVFRATDASSDEVFAWAVMGKKGPEWITMLKTHEADTPAKAVRAWRSGH